MPPKPRSAWLLSASSLAAAAVVAALAAAVLAATGAPASHASPAAHFACAQSADPGPRIHEPLVRKGATELISGLFLVGGPLRHSARCRHGVPSPGTVIVRQLPSHRAIARRRVREGQLARIPLAPGRYEVIGTFANADRNGTPIQSQPETVRIVRGQSVRQDTIASIS